MAGNQLQGLKARDTNRARYGDDWYARIGAKGGSKGNADGVLKGFAVMPKDKVRATGAKGGRASTKPRT